MAERLPYSGTPLPTGLPGVGGSTVEVLILPGFNTVVAAQTFGPTVDAPEATVPTPIPPEGSDPKNPTEAPVTPGVVGGNGYNIPPFCQDCRLPDDSDLVKPLYFGKVYDDYNCTDCNGDNPRQVMRPTPTIGNWESAGDPLNPDFKTDYVQWNGLDELRGNRDTTEGLNTWNLAAEGLYGEDKNTDNKVWSIDPTGVRLGEVFGEHSLWLEKDRIIMGLDEYTPKQIQVCVDGSTQTWKVLAKLVP